MRQWTAWLVAALALSVPACRSEEPAAPDVPPPSAARLGEKGDGSILCEAPEGPSRQNTPVPFFSEMAPAELRGTWHEVAARLSPEAWEEIKVFLKNRVNTTPSDKEDGLQALYEYVRGPEIKGGELGAVKMLLDTDAPEIVHELLLNPHKDIVITACEHLLKNKAEEPDKQPAKKDEQAVPFLIYALARNNYIQEGSEEASVHRNLKRQLVAALLHITDLGGQVGKIDVDREEDIGRVLTAARAWAAEKKMEPLEKQRAPKPESKTEKGDGSLFRENGSGASANADPFAEHLRALEAKVPEGFTIVPEPPFVVIGDEAPEVVRARAEQTVRWAVVHLKALYFEKDPAQILDIWLFKDKASYERHTREIFGEEPTTPSGYCSPAHGALIMNIATGGGTLVHEIVHPFMAANFPACPAWFNEGLGSLYEQSAERDGRIVGLTNWRLEGLQDAIRAGRVPSFETLTAMSDRAFYAEDKGTNYAQARYLCYYLQEHGLLVKFYQEFRAAAAEDPTGYETLNRILGEADMAAFQKRWETWVLGLRFP